MKKIYIKAYYSGWKEATICQAKEFIKHLLLNSGYPQNVIKNINNHLKGESIYNLLTDEEIKRFTHDRT